MVDKPRYRQGWVDRARGVGIILVVYGHVVRGIDSAGLGISATFFHWSDTLVYSFHMPLFFFLSGIFLPRSLARRGGRGLIGEKGATILYPYVVWSLLQGLIALALSRYTNGHLEVVDLLSLAWHPYAHFWFLYALFWMFVVAVACDQIAGRWGLWLLAVVSMALIVKPSLCGFVAFYPMANGIVYFALGAVLTRHLSAALAMVRSSRALVLLALIFAGAEVAAISLGLTSAVAARVLVAVLGIAATIVLASRIGEGDRWHWLSVLGRASMPIYLAHVLAASAVRIVLQKALGIDHVVVHAVTGTVIGLAAPFALLQICRGRGWMYMFEPPFRPADQPATAA